MATELKIIVLKNGKKVQEIVGSLCPSRFPYGIEADRGPTGQGASSYSKVSVIELEVLNDN